MNDSALARAALARLNGSALEEQGQQDTALRDAAKEAWDAVKADDFDGFATALRNAIEIGRIEDDG